MQDLEYAKNTTPQDQIDSITALFASYTALSQSYNTINVTHCSNLSTFIPKPFFNEENLATYLKYTVKVLKNDFITYDTFRNTEMVNVYIPSVHLNNFLFDQFGTFDYKHSSTILVENLLKKLYQFRKHTFYCKCRKELFSGNRSQTKKVRIL